MSQTELFMKLWKTIVRGIVTEHPAVTLRTLIALLEEEIPDSIRTELNAEVREEL